MIKEYPLNVFKTDFVYSLVEFCVTHAMITPEIYEAFKKLDNGEQDMTPEDFERLGLRMGDIKGRIRRKFSQYDYISGLCEIIFPSVVLN